MTPSERLVVMSRDIRAFQALNCTRHVQYLIKTIGKWDYIVKYNTRAKHKDNWEVWLYSRSKSPFYRYPETDACSAPQLFKCTEEVILHFSLLETAWQKNLQQKKRRN